MKKSKIVPILAIRSPIADDPAYSFHQKVVIKPNEVTKGRETNPHHLPQDVYLTQSPSAVRSVRPEYGLVKLMYE